MSALFDAWFGFIFWGVAYFRMRQADDGDGWWWGHGWRRLIVAVVNVVIILIGLLFLSAGTYASVESIVLGYAASTFHGGSFSCIDNGL